MEELIKVLCDEMKPFLKGFELRSLHKLYKKEFWRAEIYREAECVGEITFRYTVIDIISRGDYNKIEVSLEDPDFESEWLANHIVNLLDPPTREAKEQPPMPAKIVVLGNMALGVGGGAAPIPRCSRGAGYACGDYLSACHAR